MFIFDEIVIIYYFFQLTFKVTTEQYLLFYSVPTILTDIFTDVFSGVYTVYRKICPTLGERVKYWLMLFRGKYERGGEEEGSKKEKLRKKKHKGKIKV